MQMREAIESGALHMIALFIKLENETNFMMVEPEKKQISVEGRALVVCLKSLVVEH